MHKGSFPGKPVKNVVICCITNTRDGKEYRNRLYDYDDIQKIIFKYGLPQIWNPDFKYGPENYRS